MGRVAATRPLLCLSDDSDLAAAVRRQRVVTAANAHSWRRVLRVQGCACRLRPQCPLRNGSVRQVVLTFTRAKPLRGPRVCKPTPHPLPSTRPSSCHDTHSLCSLPSRRFCNISHASGTRVAPRSSLRHTTARTICRRWPHIPRHRDFLTHQATARRENNTILDSQADPQA